MSVADSSRVGGVALSLASDTLSPPRATRLAMRQATLRIADSFVGPEAWSYPPPDGEEGLREAIRCLAPDRMGDVLITNSATEATWLALSAAAAAGGRRLAVQIPCYFGVLRQAAALGFAVDAWETPEDLLVLKGFDVLLLTSNFPPPTGRGLGDEERRAVAAVAIQTGAVVIEDNPYDPIWFSAPPVGLPTPPERTILIGSLSKIASPRLRLGFLRASGPLGRAVRSARITLSLSACADTQEIACAALAPLVLEELRSDLAARAAHLRAGLSGALGVEITPPDGGSYLALPLGHIPPGAFAAACAAEGVRVDASNARQFPDGRERPWARLHLGACPAVDMPAAAAALVRAVLTCRGVRPAQRGEGR